jgi:elongator complex protein 1
MDPIAGTMNMIDSQEPLVSTSTYEDSTSLEGYGQDLSGTLYQLSETTSDPLPIQFPIHLPWFELVKFDGEITAFGLSRNGHIYANSRLLAKNCTSFVVTPSHLIFTTSNHFVKYVHLVPSVEGT